MVVGFVAVERDDRRCQQHRVPRQERPTGIDPAPQRVEGTTAVEVDVAERPGRPPRSIVRGQARFDEHGIEADLCLVVPDDGAEEAIVDALTRADYACVVIGGGIREHEPLLGLFEKVVNLMREHAPGAAIAFNSTPEDTADAALRWLR